ncbi:MAG TPA: AraC family transcriptional regulator [Thermoanaerobaculia bacterium]|jgi:AraC-like DNA-binding protein|nr:AraC family transcriptional regulator [Thermoanaerobaculia bacterium]
MAPVDHDTFRRLCRSRDFLAASFGERLRLEQAAASACFSPFHYHRLFRRAFGETPHEFLTRLRLDEAKRLLAAGERSVTDICFGLGYESLGSFSLRFKERVGCSPSEYRRRVRCSIAAPQRWVPRLVPSCFIRFFAGLPPSL